MEQGMSAFERHERGLVLKQVQIFDKALEEFQQAATDPQYAGEAHVQIGLCFRSTGRYEEAVAAFRQALTWPPFSSERSVRILYLLGLALESLGRYAETLEIYRWIIREDPGFLDVVHRIEDLSSGRDPVCRRQPADQSWVGDMLKSCQGLLKIK
jgi:tetratricopeptide (TPR) repeat protein